MMREFRLFKKYGITDLRGLDPDSPYRKLALALAERYESDFKPRGRGRPKKYDDDPELFLMVELLSQRDGLSVAEACRVIAEKGAIKGKATTLRDRYKALMHESRGHWKMLRSGLESLAGDRDRYIEGLEEVVGGNLK
jgi:hypothetical protein